VQALVHHALLGLGVAGLLGAAWRVADNAAPAGLARVVATAVVAAALAVLEALALGIVGAGGSSVALALAAVLTYAVAWRLIARPELSARVEVIDWWGAAKRPARAAAGAGVVLLVGWIGWQLRTRSSGRTGSPTTCRWPRRGPSPAIPVA